MTRDKDTVWCDGCGAEISWAPIVAGGRDYCCEDCQEGKACLCGERMELGDEYRTEQASTPPGNGGDAQ